MSAANPAICPKCGHHRTAADTAPAWQCPSCGIAYNNSGMWLRRSRQTPPPIRAGENWIIRRCRLLALIHLLVFFASLTLAAYLWLI